MVDDFLWVDTTLMVFARDPGLAFNGVRYCSSDPPARHY